MKTRKTTPARDFRASHYFTALVLAALACLIAVPPFARAQSATGGGVEVLAIVGGDASKEFASPTGVTALPEGGWAVADSALGAVKVLSAAGKVTATITSATKGAEMAGPFGVAATPDKLFVSDQKRSRVLAFDHKGTFLYAFGDSNEIGGLSRPAGIAVPGDGRVYVADTGNRRVAVYTEGGLFLHGIGDGKGGVVQLTGPTYIAVGQEEMLFVVDTKESRLFVLDRNQRHQDVELVNAKVPNPAGVSTLPDGGFALIESLSGQIYLYNADLTPRQSFGSEGASRGQVHQPSGVACNSAGQCLVADTGNQRAQLFSVPTLAGRPALPPLARPFQIELKETIWHGFHDVAATANGDVYGAMAKNTDGVLLHLTPPLEAGGKWVRRAPILPPPAGMGKAGPSSVAMCPDGTIVLGDTAVSKIHVYSPDGTYKLSFGQSGDKPGSFSKLGGVACGAGAVYVADTGNVRVQLFSQTGVFLGAFGAKGEAPGQFKTPVDVGVTKKGDVWVADSGLGTVQLFSSKGTLKTVLGERTGGQRDKPRTLSLMLADDNAPTNITRSGKLEARFPAIEAVAVDSDDFVFARERGRMHVFDPTGVKLLSFGSPGNGKYDWEAAGGIGLAGSLVYIPDPKNQRTQVFTLGRIPDVPHDIVLTSAPGQAILSWSAPTESFLAGYNVYMLGSGGKVEQVGTTAEPKFVVNYPPGKAGGTFFVTTLSTRGLESGRAGPVVDYYNAGYAAYENGDMDTALKHFADALRANPKHALALEYRGKALYAQGKPDEADKVFKELLNFPEGKPAGYRGLGMMALAKGDFAGAEQELERARAADPRDSATLNAQAELFLARRMYFKARERAQQSLQSGVQDARLHEIVGLSYLGEKLYGKAAQSLARAIDLAPDRVRLYRELADVHVARRDPGAARDALADALKRYPGNAELLLTRAEVAIAVADYEAANKDISDVLVANPENPRAHLLRGQMYAAQKRSEDAISEFGSARALAPKNPEVLFAIAQAYTAAKMPTQADSALTDLLTVDPNNQDALLLGGQLHLDGGRLEEADQAADKCLTLDANNARAYLLKGKVAMKAGSAPVAVQHFRKADQLQPDDTTILLATAEALVAAKREAEARATYGQVLRLDGSNAEAHHAVGALMLAGGEFEPAIEELNLATFLKSDEAEYWHDLGHSYAGALQYEDAIAAYTEAQKLKPTEARYKVSLNKAFEQKKSYRSTGHAPDLEVRLTRFGPVYSAASQSYQNQPIGKVTLKNLGNTLFYNIKVSFTVPTYMTAPYEATIHELKPSGTQTVEIRPTFASAILQVAENKPVVGKVTVTYVQDRRPKTMNSSAPFTLISANGLTWSDKAMTGAFITPKDWPVNEFSRATLTAYAGGTDPVSSVLGSEAIAKAMLLYDALSAARLRYLEDPNQPFAAASTNFTAVDYVQFPRDTLRLKSGDCDDLVMLYAALLENVGVSTAIVDMPGHMLVAFNTGLPEARASILSDSPNDYLLRGGRVWLPVEMTVVGKSFTEAWTSGARLYNERKAKGVSFVDTADSWQRYAPVSLPLTQFRATPPDRSAIDAYVADERKRFDERRIAALTAPLRARLASNPADHNARLRLGSVFASQGMFSEAREQFTQVLAADDKSTDAMVNLGNLSFVEGNYPAALEYYRNAESLVPKDAQIKFNLALAYYRIGSRDEAKAKFGEAAEIDPDMPTQNAQFKALLDK